VENYVKKNMMELNAIDDKEKNNLLNFAVQSGYYEIVELLIKNGLPINTKNVSATLVLLWRVF
jgi:ankyrin repeat protein